MIYYSLNELSPHHLSDCIRLGTDADGGYVVNQRIIANTDFLIGLGISDDWSFEEDFAKKNPRTKILGLDFSVSDRIYRKMIFLAFLQIFFLYPDALRRFIKRIKIWRNFRSFWSRPNAQFVQMGVSDLGHKQSCQAKGMFVTFEEVVELIREKHGSIPDNSMFIKMDIELSEFRVIPDLLKFSRYLNGMVIEFHDLDITWDRFQGLISLIKSDFYITHIHGCNGNSVIPNTNIPSLIELTFLKKDFVEEKELGKVINYPVKGLDFPHTKERDEVTFTFNLPAPHLIIYGFLSFLLDLESDIFAVFEFLPSFSL